MTNSKGQVMADGHAPRLVIIDNYDSFTYNLVQYFGELGADVTVYRNDQFSVDALVADPPDGIVISPGPGTPDDAGLSNEVVARFAGVRPVFGVCLGLQCIGVVYGGKIVRAPELMHGKTSLIHHHNEGVFVDLPSPFEATRYHSLIVDRASVPDVLTITAETADGLIMGLRHTTFDVEGVQFHPESILTADGHRLLDTFVQRCKPYAAKRVAASSA
ncbi:MAG: aminodeoxychorismate/anthranilate synthase component II [Nitriliruptoraceae bacterium]